ncbi:MAG TPA: class I SAM-dependent methyltransferase [Candidatus Limnocylindria bacterium]|nr:class I SAM-dependent methyltransferase [Candidatus Limnocylindria bacterium]
MATNLTSPQLSERETLISCQNSQGGDVRATPVRITRYTATFEVYNPFSIIQLSEVLSDFKITINERLAYHGRAVVSNLVNTGVVLLCEATLDESWLDVDMFSPVGHRERLLGEFAEFVKDWEKIHNVTPDFKVVVADMQALLADLRRWLEQVELGIRSSPGGNRQQLEREVLMDLSPPMLPTINNLFDRFEGISGKLSPELLAMHGTYIKRQLHPLVLCAPFAYRTFQKPLGYAGDYEMVNMILNDPHEGGSLFAKTVNLYFLNSGPAVAHRNRIKYLIEVITGEVKRVAAAGRDLRIMNLGCGPAGEIQQLLAQEELTDRMDFTLMDFNDETLEFTNNRLNDLKSRYHRQTRLQFIKKSVHQLLKEGSRISAGQPKFDLVYCAGLFDYLSDRICQRLMNIFYEMLAPGGLLVATNVDPSNPSRHGMELILDWHLTYRNQEQLKWLHPTGVPESNIATKSDETGVNIYIEVRRPDAG